MAPEPSGGHLHLLDHDLVFTELLHRGEPLDLHAFGEGFHRFVRMRLHLRLVEPEDQHGFLGAEPFRDARGVHGRVAAADDADDAPERRGAALFHLLHQRDGVDDLAAVHGRDIEMVGDLGADAEKHRIESAGGLLGEHIVHARVAMDRHAHRLDARDLLHESFARQAVGRNAVMHHAAGLGVGIADLDLVSEAAQLIRARQPRGTSADHEHALAGGRAGRHGPAVVVGEIAEKPIERMDRDGRIEVLPVAGAFAGVITGAAVRPGSGFSSMYFCQACS